MLNDPQFWVLVAFIIFIVTIFKPIKKYLTSNLDNKINEIKENIMQAEKIRNDAQQTLSEIKKRQNNIKKEIAIINQKSKEKISIIEKNITQKLNEKISKRKQLASAKIDHMTKEANLEMHQYVIQSTINATLMILEKKLNQTEKQNLIHQSIMELTSVLKH